MVFLSFFKRTNNPSIEFHSIPEQTVLDFERLIYIIYVSFTGKYNIS